MMVNNAEWFMNLNYIDFWQDRTALFRQHAPRGVLQEAEWRKAVS